MNENVKPSRIGIVFEGYGSAMFQITIENVTPVQMLGLAAYLKWSAESNLDAINAEAIQQQMMNKIAVPEPQILIGR